LRILKVINAAGMYMTKTSFQQEFSNLTFGSPMWLTITINEIKHLYKYLTQLSN